MPSVVISGAGIAGSTAAYWLAKHGFAVTVVERVTGVRSSGAPVDVRGPAVAVAERMGVLPAVRAADTGVRNLAFVDARGRTTSRVDMRLMRADTGDIELPRGELAAVLRGAVGPDVEFLLGDSITDLAQDSRGVDVHFEHAAPRRFDLVVGADGVHSQVRALAFGPEPDFVRHLGIYVATLPLPAGCGPDLVVYNTPGKAVAIHPAPGRAMAAFMYRAPQIAAFDHRNLDQHKQLLRTAFAGVGWRVPELLDRVCVADDLYFDSVSRVHVERWSRGRITLVGDAASCVSLFGDGSSLAMLGGYTLAESLAESLTDGPRTYQARHRRRTDPKERGAPTGARVLVPATGVGIRARNLAARLWPVVAALQRARRMMPRENACPTTDTTNSATPR